MNFQHMHATVSTQSRLYEKCIIEVLWVDKNIQNKYLKKKTASALFILKVCGVLDIFVCTLHLLHTRSALAGLLVCHYVNEAALALLCGCALVLLSIAVFFFLVVLLLQAGVLTVAPAGAGCLVLRVGVHFCPVKDVVIWCSEKVLRSWVKDITFWVNFTSTSCYNMEITGHDLMKRHGKVITIRRFCIKKRSFAQNRR